MNKILTFVILVVLGSAKMNAQEPTFGAKIGGNYSRVTGDNSSNYDPSTAIVIGVMAEIPLTKRLSFQPEIIFSRQGYRSDVYDLKIKYINIPLMAKFYLVDKFSLEVGPQIGFRSLAIAETPIGDYDARNDIKSIDLGVDAGIGYKLENGLNFGIRYNHGFSNITKYVGDKVTNHNAVVQATVGFFF